MIQVALVQTNIKPYAVDENFEHYRELLAKGINRPVQLIVFPEMYTTGFVADLWQEADFMHGRSTEFLSQIANTYHCDVVASMPIKEGDKLFNRLVWMSPKGILAYYDKRHLFLGEEQKQCTEGNDRRIIETLGTKFLPLICYDIRFPIWSRNRFCKGQFAYDCLVYITNFPSPREEILLKLAMARAIENQAYVLVVNRVGYDGNGFVHGGGTAVIDPEGKVLASAQLHSEEVVMAALDMERLARQRQCFPVATQWD